jgi:hypothetical protein
MTFSHKQIFSAQKHNLFYKQEWHESPQGEHYKVSVHKLLDSCAIFGNSAFLRMLHVQMHFLSPLEVVRKAPRELATFEFDLHVWKVAVMHWIDISPKIYLFEI